VRNAKFRKTLTLTKKLITIDTGYASFGIVVKGNKVIEAPALAEWMIGKLWDEVKDWDEIKSIHESIVDE